MLSRRLRSPILLSWLLLAVAACSETTVARGRGGSSGGGGTFDTGSQADGSVEASGDTSSGEDAASDAEPTDTGTIGDVADDTTAADTGTDDTAVIDDTTVTDTTPDDTSIADTTPADTTAEDTAPADTTVADTTPTDTSVADTTPADTTPTDTSVADTTPADTTPAPYVCGDAPIFTGQIGGDIAPTGGFALPVASRASFAYGNANLSSVALQMPTVDGVTVPLASPVPVVGAVVVATSYLSAASVPPSQSNFWVSDRFGTIELRLDYTNIANVPPFPIQVGQRINFTATSVNRYQGIGQIQAATDWALVGDGAGVHLLERTDSPVTITDLSEIVRVEGLITGGGAACGGSSRCFDLTYAGGSIATLRTSSTFAAIGQCVTFVGPLRQYAGVLQLDAVNFDWLATVY